MDLQSIEDAMAAEPFEPLRIRLESGAFCDVRHPDSIFVHQRQLLIIDRADAAKHVIRAYRFIDPQVVRDVVPVRLAEIQPQADELHEIIAPAARVVDWLESLLALLATGLICAVVAFSGIALYLNVGKDSPIKDVAALLVWAVLISIEVMLLVRVVRFYRKRLYPLPLLYALAHDPPRERLTRLGLSGFWVAHAIAGVIVFAWLELSFSEINRGRMARDRWLDEVILLIFVTAGAHASMTFFLLAARSFGATPRFVRRLWRFRLLLDLLVVGSVWLYPQWLFTLLHPFTLLMRNLRYLMGTG